MKADEIKLKMGIEIRNSIKRVISKGKKNY